MVSRFTVIPSTYGWYCVRQYAPYRLSANYRIMDAVALADWLEEREAGYPRVMRNYVTNSTKDCVRAQDRE